MHQDFLSVWMEGHDHPAGQLTTTGGGEIGFAYAEAYKSAGGLALSLSLPLKRGHFGDAETRAYFANLLPENNQLQVIMEREGVARDDVVGLLRHSGSDCAGAVSCLPGGLAALERPGVLAEDYERLSEPALSEIVEGLHERRRLPVMAQAPGPLAGVQCKVALTVLPDGGLALPRPGSGVPTTHILKVPGRGEGGDARLEESCARLARSAGLDVSVPTAIKVGDIDALLIERFDRRVENGVVTRIHQEDFAQALGLPSGLKYQRHGQPPRQFDLAAAMTVLDRTLDPAQARIAFLEATLLNLCLGNTDNHAKNHALLYDQGPVPRLAPLYDLLPIRIDNRYTHELAFNLGRARFYDDITREDLEAVFTAIGVRQAEHQAVLDEVVVSLVRALEDATPILRGQGLKGFDDLIGRETERLVEVLGLDTPVRERDYVPADRAGAWGQAS